MNILNVRRYLIALLLISIAVPVFAQKKDGYRIKVKFDTKANMQDSVAYLAHYYGKPLPTIYKSDSAKFDKNNTLVFESDEKALGGIYIFLLSDKQTYFEFLLDNGDDLNITVDPEKLPLGLKFKNSPDNVVFLEYIDFLQGFSEEQKKYEVDLAMAKTAADTAAVREKAQASSDRLSAFRRSMAAKHPNTLVGTIFNALDMPKVPEGKHYLADGKTEDSMFAYRYYKDHYWDKFDLNDDRLVHTPLYDARLDEYFNKLVYPAPDSMEYEADKLLAKVRNHPELFKYSLWWLTRNAETSKIMGMDEVFVYLVENYYMKGDAVWLSQEDLTKYIDRASKIAPNVIGNVAPEIKMQDVNGKERTLSSVDAKYTLVVFWSPDCGHCLKEIPRIDSVYRAGLKDMGVKVFAVRTDEMVDKWKEIIKKEKLEDWIHVHDPEHKSNFRSMYDVYSTPVIYLLDSKKIIRGKRLDHTNIMSFVKMLEEKEKNKS